MLNRALLLLLPLACVLAAPRAAHACDPDYSARMWPSDGAVDIPAAAPIVLWSQTGPVAVTDIAVEQDGVVVTGSLTSVGVLDVWMPDQPFTPGSTITATVAPNPDIWSVTASYTVSDTAVAAVSLDDTVVAVPSIFDVEVGPCLNQDSCGECYERDIEEIIQHLQLDYTFPAALATGDRFLGIELRVYTDDPKDVITSISRWWGTPGSDYKANIRLGALNLWKSPEVCVIPVVHDPVGGTTELSSHCVDVPAAAIDSEGSDSEGSDSEGSDSEGSDSEGSDSEGENADKEGCGCSSDRSPAPVGALLLVSVPLLRRRRR